MSSLQNKMHNYEVVPPANVWENISVALDESASGSKFPSTLYNAEVTPPADAWENINTALHPEETKVVSLKRRTPAFIRYAAAAVLIGLAAFGVVRLTAGSSTDDSVAVINKDTLKNRNVAVQNPVQDSEPVPTPDQRDLLQPEPVSKKYTSKSAIAQISSALFKYNEPIEIDLHSNPLYDYGTTSDVVDRYFMFMTPEGNIIRMSKKLGNLVCCVSGEEQDADCKSQLKKWQEKLATSPADASSGNFLDILTLMNSLEEGTEL